MGNKEFRIGNIVNAGGLYLPYGEGVVCEILADCLIINIGGEINQYPYDDVSGILLTEEKLLEFGFDRNDELSAARSSYEFPKLKDGSRMGLFFLVESKPILSETTYYDLAFPSNNGACYKPSFNQCQYLHQLQNLYFALMGEELKSLNYNQLTT